MTEGQDMPQDMGATPSGSGCQPTASAADASSRSGIPSAYPHGNIEFVREAFGSAALLSVTVWDDEAMRLHLIADILEEALTAIPNQVVLIRRRTVRDVAGPWACVLDFRVKAIATEAGTATTPQSGVVHEGAGPKDIAHD